MAKMDYNYLTFTVDRGEVIVTDMRQWECRGDNSLFFLRNLVKKNPLHFDGRKGMMSFLDFPPDAGLALDYDLAFCSTKRRAEPSPFVEMPCPYSVGWPHVGIPDGEKLLHQLLGYPHGPEVSKLFWIGANTHPSRSLLHELSRENPEIIEAELMGWRGTGNICQESSSRYVSLVDHAKYKYLIDCPGEGYSARLRWLLATGRPVFVVERDFVEHWHEEMVPWVHYIPVQRNLSDLIEALSELESRSWLCSEIGENARKFVRDNLVFEKQLSRAMENVHAVDRLRKLQK